MSLKQEWKKQGNYLFKRRSFLPLVFLVLGTAALSYTVHYAPSRFFGWLGWPLEAAAFVVSWLGLVVRSLSVGYAHDNTSGRNVHGQKAEAVNTKGMYATVRHPLYVGNFLMWLGVALLTRNVWFLLAFCFIFWVYYERIMFAEEQFLKKKFGGRYKKWAAKTPAFLPNLANWQSPERSFNVKKVLRQEKNGLLALVIMFFLMEQLTVVLYAGELVMVDLWWYVALGVGVLVYAALKVLKKFTSVLEDSPEGAPDAVELSSH